MTPTKEHAFDEPSDATVPMTAGGASTVTSNGTPVTPKNREGPPLVPIPAEIGEYAVDGLLGTGGMGEVFLARDPRLGRPIALKRIIARRARDPSTLARFILEARVTAMLQHPSIIPVYDFSEVHSGVFYTMRPVEGSSLAALVAKLRDDERAKLEEWTVRHLVRLFLQAASAVAFAHSKGIIHRDLKPGNIMIGPFEEVLVLDWGVAKVVGDDTDELGPTAKDLRLPDDLATGPRALETPAYMAPELLRGAHATVASDIFSLGVILYELLALRPPWRSDSLADLLDVMDEQPVSPTQLQPSRDIPLALVDVIYRAIAPEASERYTSVNDFSHEVAQAVEGRVAWIPEGEGQDATTWVLLDGHVAETEHGAVFSSKGRRNIFRYAYGGNVAGDIRVAFDMLVPRGTHTLGVLLNTPATRHAARGAGYRFSVLVGRSRAMSLLRNGRDVAGASVPELQPHTWYGVVVERKGNRFSLRVAGEEIYSHVDPIALRGGAVVLTGRSSNGIHIRNLLVSSQGVSASVSCLAVPDAFFNRGLHDDARIEYERIAASLPGHSEGREAAFRAGLCMVEAAREEADAELREMFLAEAEHAYASHRSDASSCLQDLGRAIVSHERRDIGQERESLVRVLTAYPDDPRLPMGREWLLSRLHSAIPRDRTLIAELTPLAIRHCRGDGAGRRVIRDVVRHVRRAWERPAFMGTHLEVDPETPQARAEADLFFGFWSIRMTLIEDAIQEFITDIPRRRRHIGDTVFALLEIGDTARADRLLTSVEEHRAERGGAGTTPGWMLACRSAVATGLGKLDDAEKEFRQLTPNGSDRLYNSTRLFLSRALLAAGKPRDALRVMRPCRADDRFAFEHRAWLRLMAGDCVGARDELAVLIADDRHREGRDMTSFLLGVCLIMDGNEPEARKVCGGLAAVAQPRTWTLGTHLVAGHLGEDDLERYVGEAFPWERRCLTGHMALLARAKGDSRECERLLHLSTQSLVSLRDQTPEHILRGD